LSARSGIDCGIVIPSALAIFKFTMSLNVDTYSTGKSATLHPDAGYLRLRPALGRPRPCRKYGHGEHQRVP